LVQLIGLQVTAGVVVQAAPVNPSAARKQKDIVDFVVMYSLFGMPPRAPS
jgi:hypothetical protein